MIRLSNGWKIENVTGSGATNHDGRGYLHERILGLVSGGLLFNPPMFDANILKTLTRDERTGNFRKLCPWRCIRLIWRKGRIVGVVNSVGLTNRGAKWWAREVGPKVNRHKNALIASISGLPAELVEMARILQPFDLIGLEINASCPNTEHDISSNCDAVVQGCKDVRKETRFPLLLKLSVANEAENIVKQLGGVVEAISINSVPWHVTFPNKRSPLEHLGSGKFKGGGVSGKIVQAIEWEFIDRLNGVTDIPKIGSSAWSRKDVDYLRHELRVGAIAYTSVHIPFCWWPTCNVRRELRERAKLND